MKPIILTDKAALNLYMAVTEREREIGVGSFLAGLPVRFFVKRYEIQNESTPINGDD